MIRTPRFCTYRKIIFGGFTFARRTDDDVRTAEDAVVVDGCGHEDRSSSEPLTRARGCLRLHGCGRSECVRGTSAQNDAGFDRQRGRSRQHHDNVNGLLLPLQKPDLDVCDSSGKLGVPAFHCCPAIGGLMKFWNNFIFLPSKNAPSCNKRRVKFCYPFFVVMLIRPKTQNFI